MRQELRERICGIIHILHPCGDSNREDWEGAFIGLWARLIWRVRLKQVDKEVVNLILRMKTDINAYSYHLKHSKNEYNVLKADFLRVRDIGRELFALSAKSSDDVIFYDLITSE